MPPSMHFWGWEEDRQVTSQYKQSVERSFATVHAGVWEDHVGERHHHPPRYLGHKFQGPLFLFLLLISQQPTHHKILSIPTSKYLSKMEFVC